MEGGARRVAVRAARLIREPGDRVARLPLEPEQLQLQPELVAVVGAAVGA